VPLGVLIVLNLMIAGGVTALIDGGRLFGLLMNPSPPELDQDAVTRRVAETFADPRVQFGMLSFAVLCALPLILALWWAPALVVFQDAGVRTALRASLRAGRWPTGGRSCAGGLVVFLFTTLLPFGRGRAAVPGEPAASGADVLPRVRLFTVYLWSIVAVIHISDLHELSATCSITTRRCAPIEHGRPRDLNSSFRGEAQPRAGRGCPSVVMDNVQLHPAFAGMTPHTCSIASRTRARAI
jgi:hypothetical protein